jgi:hypothetical protein
MQTSLFLSFLFAVFTSLILFYSIRPIPLLQVREARIIGEEGERENLTLLSSVEQTDLTDQDLKDLRQEWLESDASAPLPLANSHLRAKIDWVESSLFRRQDYTINIQFPFKPASARIIISSQLRITPIVYRSDLPYEIDPQGNLSFTLGPNPPENLSFSFSFSAENTSRLSLWLSFDSMPYEKEIVLGEDETIYRLLWTQRIVQMGGVVREESGSSPHSLNATLDEDPAIQRLRERPLPEQKLFALRET